MDLMRTDSTPDSSIRVADSSSISSPALARRSSVMVSYTSSKATLPKTLSLRDSITSSPSFKADTLKPKMVPQSRSVMITSWATSTSLLVR